MAHTDFTFFLHVAPSHEIKRTVAASSTASQRLVEVVHTKVWDHSAHLVKDPDELAVCHLGKAVANLGEVKNGNFRQWLYKCASVIL